MVAGSSVAVLSVLVWFDVLCDLRVDLLLGVACGGLVSLVHLGGLVRWCLRCWFVFCDWNWRLVVLVISSGLLDLLLWL